MIVLFGAYVRRPFVFWYYTDASGRYVSAIRMSNIRLISDFMAKHNKFCHTYWWTALLERSA